MRLWRKTWHGCVRHDGGQIGAGVAGNQMTFHVQMTSWLIFWLRLFTPCTSRTDGIIVAENLYGGSQPNRRELRRLSKFCNTGGARRCRHPEYPPRPGHETGLRAGRDWAMSINIHCQGWGAHGFRALCAAEPSSVACNPLAHDFRCHAMRSGPHEPYAMPEHDRCDRELDISSESESSIASDQGTLTFLTRVQPGRKRLIGLFPAQQPPAWSAPCRRLADSR